MYGNNCCLIIILLLCCGCFGSDGGRLRHPQWPVLPIGGFGGQAMGEYGDQAPNQRK